MGMRLPDLPVAAHILGMTGSGVNTMGYSPSSPEPGHSWIGPGHSDHYSGTLVVVVAQVVEVAEVRTVAVAGRIAPV
jgi:hypothetical protein